MGINQAVLELGLSMHLLQFFKDRFVFFKQVLLTEKSYFSYLQPTSNEVESVHGLGANPNNQ